MASFLSLERCSRDQSAPYSTQVYGFNLELMRLRYTERMTVTLEPQPVPLRADQHGVLRVGRTRVTLDLVIYAFLEGATPEDIVQRYTALELGDVYAVIAYYLRHHDALDAYLREREAQAVTVRLENEQRFPPEGIRARLLARRAHP